MRPSCQVTVFGLHQTAFIVSLSLSHSKVRVLETKYERILTITTCLSLVLEISASNSDWYRQLWPRISVVTVLRKNKSYRNFRGASSSCLSVLKEDVEILNP
jgi:hypothetical protein